MAKSVSPDKGKSVESYRNEKINIAWQGEVFDQIHAMIQAAYPDGKSSIKWAQPVWETAEGPMLFMRATAKHLTLGFWRGAEFQDPEGVLEGEGDRMKHLKIKSQETMNPAQIEGFIAQAIALNAQKGNPTKGK
jgi:hypothetical protein